MSRAPASTLVIMSVLWTAAAPSLAADFAIDFNWDGIERCSSTPPEITVSDVPDGTATFDVKMVDLDFTGYNHGGGTAPNTGDGSIVEGDYDTSNYRGPCPPGTTHTYEFTVQALDAGGASLATATAKADFPPE